MRSFTKTTSDILEKFNGLSKDKSFQLEKDCLELLHTNYQCVCKVKRQHFPIIIQSDNETHTFELTHQGTSVNHLIRLGKKVYIRELNKQIDCIMHNLQLSNVRHLDIHPNGKNVCVSDGGAISLIDFNMASIGDNYESTLLKERADKHKKYQAYLGSTKKLILRIVESVKD